MYSESKGRVREAWSEEWCVALLGAIVPENFEAHLVGRPRARAGASGWTPAARVSRVRAGLVARFKLDHEEGAYSPSPDIPQSNRRYIVLRGAPRKSAGWTEDNSTFLAAVPGKCTQTWG